MMLGEFIKALRDAGWRGVNDVQYKNIARVWEQMTARAEAAEAEVARLREVLTEAQRDLEELYKNSACVEWDQVSSLDFIAYVLRGAAGKE